MELCPSYCFRSKKGGKQDFPLMIAWPSINQDIKVDKNLGKTLHMNNFIFVYSFTALLEDPSSLNLQIQFSPYHLFTSLEITGPAFLKQKMKSIGVVIFCR